MLQTLADAANGDGDAVVALMALGHVGLVLFGKSHNAAITSDYSEMLLQLMSARRYAEIVSPDASSSLDDIAQAWREAFDSDITDSRKPGMAS